ncbi:unnamed protein product [Plutella xylostella]|uniref:Beta-galactosidase n=1 Tax=Plutella xylostella TaxID=51655 RepID=A0A8S4DE86_PLUXY|nr:unnamed protein product [Plutella xylostella]
MSRPSCWVALAAACCVVVLAGAGVSTPTVIEADTVGRKISIEGDDFMLDGQPFRIRSGEVHYFRTPAAYWPDRLRMVKAAGLNAVATYVEWMFHEGVERQYRWDGDRDLARFVSLAQQQGLLVLLRPGPYICAERDLGGLPYWLMGKYPDIKLRTLQPEFMSESTIWFNELFKQVKPLLYGNGGPIILVQVENEYGSYGSDHAYMNAMRALLHSHVGDHALLYTTDGFSRNFFTRGYADGALTTVDFGVTSSPVKNAFKDLREFRPVGPLMNSEFYPGWLTHWGEGFQRVATAPVVATLDDMLRTNASFNFYMFHGGTNFDFTAGANYGPTYQPDITSYDYDAPLTEAGDPTDKYYAIRSTIEKYYPQVRDIHLPLASSKAGYGSVPVVAKLQLLSSEGRTALGKKETVEGSSLPTFEQLRQWAGLVLYETTVHTDSGDVEDTRLLSIAKPRDRIYVYVNGVLKGILSRMHNILSIPLVVKNNTVLSLLVENQGRINFGDKLHDKKGILSPVLLANKVLNGTWEVTGFPLENVDVTGHDNPESTDRGPVLYEGAFTLPNNTQLLDTYVNPTGWGKGYIWINGHNLGRYWPREGPQVTLYVPGVWLQPPPAANRLQILELEAAAPGLDVTFVDTPILG